MATTKRTDCTHAAVSNSTCDSDLPNCGTVQSEGQSIPVHIVEALIHGCEDEVDLSHCNSDRSFLDLSWPTNPDEINIIMIEDDDERNFEGQLATIAPQL